jgi:tetratricopeptide (TPR) repeat protein
MPIRTVGVSLALILFFPSSAGGVARQEGPDRYLQALELVRQSRLEEAKTKLLKAIQLDTPRPEVHNLLGSVYDRLGQIDDAIRQYQRAIELEPRAAASFNNLGIAYVRKKDIERAVEAFRQALQVDPENTSSHYNLGIVYLGERKYGEAIAHLEAARRKAPSDVSVLFNLAKAQLEQGGAQAAVTLLEKTLPEDTLASVPEIQNLLGTAFARLGQIAEAVRHLEIAIRLRPDAPEPYYKLGLVLEKKGDWPAARSALERAAQRNPSPPSEYYVALGEAYRNLGLVEQARSAFQKSLAAGNPAVGHMALGALLLDLGRYKEAAAEFEWIVSRDPASVEACLKLAAALHKAGNHAAALERLRALDASKLGNDGAFYYQLLANVLAKLRQWGPALEALRKGTEVDPNSADLYFQMGLIMIGAGVPRQALELFQKVAAKRPDSATIRVGLGQACLASDQLAEAEKQLAEAVRLSPDYDEPYFLLGNCYQEQNQLEKAIASYRKALDYSPERAEFHFALGLAFSRQGNLEPALVELRKAAQLDPSPERLAKLGSIYLDKGSDAEAEAVLKKAVELSPKDPQPHYLLFRLYSRRGDKAKAEEEKGLFEKLRTTDAPRENPESSELKPIDYYLAYLKDK